MELEPLMAGYKTNISIFVACMLYKWYRSIFINKVRIALEFPIAIVYLSAYFFTHDCLVFFVIDGDLGTSTTMEYSNDFQRARGKS